MVLVLVVLVITLCKFWSKVEVLSSMTFAKRLATFCAMYFMFLIMGPLTLTIVKIVEITVTDVKTFVVSFPILLSISVAIHASALGLHLW